MTCEICGSGQSATHHTREMMLGLGDRFDYSECLGCGRLRLLNPPPDLSRYYPADYYSFAPRGAIGTRRPFCSGSRRSALCWQRFIPFLFSTSSGCST